MSKFTGVDGCAAFARAVRLFMVTPAAMEASIKLRRVSIGSLPGYCIVDCLIQDRSRFPSVSALALLPKSCRALHRRGLAREINVAGAPREGLRRPLYRSARPCGRTISGADLTNDPPARTIRRHLES